MADLASAPTSLAVRVRAFQRKHEILIDKLGGGADTDAPITEALGRIGQKIQRLAAHVETADGPSLAAARKGARRMRLDTVRQRIEALRDRILAAEGALAP
ncbi:MAG: hypothetical protein AAGC57_03395 [Pseudomonadota bacterium]